MINVPSMSKRTLSTLIWTIWGSTAGVIVPEAGYVNEGLRETAAEGGTEFAGVGIADIVNACLVKTDMMGE